jgi:hypothetical protein
MAITAEKLPETSRLKAQNRPENLKQTSNLQPGNRNGRPYLLPSLLRHNIGSQLHS